MIGDHLLDETRDGAELWRASVAASHVGPVRLPRWPWIVANVLAQGVASWLAVTTWFAPDAVVGFGYAPAGAFFKGDTGRVIAMVAFCLLWVMNALEAWYAFTVASHVPQLRPHRCGWVAQTLGLGYASLSLLIADASRAAAQQASSTREQSTDR